MATKTTEPERSPAIDRSPSPTLDEAAVVGRSPTQLMTPREFDTWLRERFIHHLQNRLA